MPLSAGTRLGPYEVASPLGAGGMGEVYRARDTRLGRDVALKVLPAEVADDPSRRQRFELEARAVAALNHPNIVSVYDVGLESGVSYMVTELVDGESLRGARFPLRKTLDLGVQIAGGLAAAHAASITHRDLKPDNILLTRDGRIKILDFGLAKVAGPRAAAGATETLTVQTEPGVVMGTFGYMSPEQVRGQIVDPRSDIFSFGVILYELLAGRRAFHGETSVETMTAILKEEPPDLPETVPSGLRQTIGHCLEKDPANRFQSARDLGFALSALGQGSSQTAALAAVAQPSRWLRRGLVALSVFALAALAVFADRMLRQTPAPAWTGVQLGGPEIALTPRISPDGHTLAFLAMVGEMTQVAVIRPESGNWTVLTHKRNGGYVDHLCWSPDGNRIYFDRVADVPMGVFSVPVLGGEEQSVLDDAQSPEALPDGSLLVLRLNDVRQMQIFRFWPETGKFQGLPIAPANIDPDFRVFPGGQQAAVVGKLIGQGSQASHLYSVELSSGRARRLVTGFSDESNLRALGIAPGGNSVLVAGNAGDLTRIVSTSKDGSAPARALLTLSQNLFGLDIGPDGTLYVEQRDSPLDVIRFPVAGGHAQKIGTLNAGGGGVDQVTLLADGRPVAPDVSGGRSRLVVLETGKDPVPLVNTTEETALPATLVGPRDVAFLIGSEPRRGIALATISNGRINRRIPFEKGTLVSLASSPDGQTLFGAAGGTIWAIPVAGGEPRKIRAGASVAVDASGQNLLVQVIETPKTRLLRVPLNGGPEQEISLTGPFHLTFDAITSNGIARDGRFLAPLASLDSWFFRPGIIDLATGRMTQIPVDQFGDYHYVGWAPDGQVVAAVHELRSRLWKFTPDRK